MAARISKEDFETKVLKNELLTIVDFYSDSCVACKKLAPALGDLEDNYEGRIEVFKVNTNFDADLASEYNVRANPTVVIFKNGEVLSKKVGALTYAEIEAWVLQYL